MHTGTSFHGKKSVFKLLTAKGLFGIKSLPTISGHTFNTQLLYPKNILC